MERFARAEQLERWFANRDWRRSWIEGNNVVHLASFLAILAEHGAPWARERLQQMADWHDTHHHPRTGFWHFGDGHRRESLLDAMAGAAHDLHLYYYLDRPVPRATQIIDSCLRLGYMGICSACVDVDVIDILCHLRACGHRRGEVDSVLERYLIELLQVQNRDGGFCDNFVTPHTLYGHTTPVRASVTWTTWFRLVAIGMIASTLIAGEGGRWTFRKTLGMGYYNAEYLKDGTIDGETFLAKRPFPLANPVLLAAARNGRFLRQRVTALGRQLLTAHRK